MNTKQLGKLGSKAKAMIFLFVVSSLSYRLLFASIMGGSTTGSVTKPTNMNVVLVEFDDVKWDSYWDPSISDYRDFNNQHLKSDVEALLASLGSYYGQNCDDDSVFGSFRDYFHEMSRQHYSPSVSVLNPADGNGYPICVELPNNKSTYSFFTFCTAARNLANSQLSIPYSDLPTTGGGSLRVCYIYAGRWCSNLDVATTMNGPAMVVPQRDISNRSAGEDIDSKIGHMGYYSHEFGHMMGSHHPDADIYHWALMRGGHKNGNPSANKPAPMSPWFLYKAGWANITSITSDMSDVDLVYNTSPTTYSTFYVREFTSDRRYVIENKQQGNTYDGGLPHVHENMDGGILIWRIDDDGLGIDDVNILAADNDVTNTWANKAEDLFRPDGSYPYNRISDYSSPKNLKLTGSEYSHFAIDNYTQNSNAIIIDFITNYWQGIIATNTIWNSTPGLYYIGGDIAVTSSATLTIESGVSINLNGNCIKVTAGAIDILNRDSLTIDVDIRLLSNTGSLKGQYSSAAAAFADATSGDQIQIYSDDTWSGAINVTCDVKVYDGATLTIADGAEVNLNVNTIKTVSGGIINKQGTVTFTPDIRLVNGSTLKGQYPTYDTAVVNVKLGDEIHLCSDVTWSGTMDLPCNIVVANDGDLTLIDQTAVNLNGFTLKTTEGGSIIKQGEVTFSPDYRLVNGGALKGQYMESLAAFADATSTDEVQIYEFELWENTMAIPCNVKIPAGYSLTVISNIQLSFIPNTRLTVNGSIQAIGTDGSRITFTRSGDSGHWDGIFIHNASGAGSDF
ncbi:hypothetical protein GF337_16745, partial [candidate division KSB1 bacterium]|nr:hypothetical protein [candidate division KSB1 bacterium]